MIPVTLLLQRIDDKLNKNSNLVGQFIPDETKILSLNEAQIKLILSKVGPNNIYKAGLDSFKKRYQDLQKLIVDYTKLSVVANNDVFNSYSSQLSSLPSKFFLPVDSYVLADRDNCKDRQLNVAEIVKHGDLQTKFKSPHYKPSFEYEEILATIDGDVFFTYSDKTFTINSLYLSYLRYPAYIDITGYTHLDGTPSVTTNCELEAYLESELVNLVVEELSMNTGNREVTQNTEKNRQTIE